MGLLITFLAVVVLAIGNIPFVSAKAKGTIALIAVLLIATISSILAINALCGNSFNYSFPGSFVTGEIPIRIDALSGWFILTINFTFITGAIYGISYMKAYHTQTSNLSLHWVCYILVHAALISICALQNSIVFIVAWEIMALSSFFLVIFEHYKTETLNAGINFLIQSHISILFLTLGFIWVASRTDSYDFLAIRTFSTQFSLLTSLALFLCFFIGFAIKSGFVPFHTWLPHAHPAAPSHISGVMSGVIIKIGIYGILRMVLLIKSDYTIMGYIILVVSLFSGIYGVMLAILQHNLKKLLAYHSIENIGIIGIGIGLGCIGLGGGNQILVILGFGGALLHTLNHSLFKSLLFYGAGNLYQSTHHINIDQMGGVAKRMPHTAFLFLIASLAICGLPPFNGFISEFFIYSGMFKGMNGSDLPGILFLVLSVFGLTLIGGLALLCFTKAFGIIFLGNPRVNFTHLPHESDQGKLIPMYAILVVILIIGVFPQYVIQLLREPIGLYTNYPGYQLSFMQFPFTETIVNIGYGAIGFLMLLGLIFAMRKAITSHRPETVGVTWNCAYIAPTAKLQYTASSFVRSYIKLAEPLFAIYKHKKEIEGVFPHKVSLHTHSEDKIEVWLITYPIIQVKHFFNRLTFLQNGNPQMYVLYGLLFITLVLLIPMIYESIHILIHFLNHL